MMTTTMTQIPPYVARWFEELKPLAINEAVPDPSRAGVFSAGLIILLAGEFLGRSILG